MANQCTIRSFLKLSLAWDSVTDTSLKRSSIAMIKHPLSTGYVRKILQYLLNTCFWLRAY